MNEIKKKKMKVLFLNSISEKFRIGKDNSKCILYPISLQLYSLPACRGCHGNISYLMHSNMLLFTSPLHVSIKLSKNKGVNIKHFLIEYNQTAEFCWTVKHAYIHSSAFTKLAGLLEWTRLLYEWRDNTNHALIRSVL